MSEDDPRDDFVLLAAWREGETSAGQALVARHTPKLHRFFASKASDAAEDLVQATFLACVQARDKFRQEAGFRTYLLAIARRILLKHFRKHARSERAMRIEEVSAEDVSPSPSFAVALRQEVRLLLRALRRIPIDQQITIELYYWEGLGIAEVAEVLEVPPGTIKSRLARAREMLRERILAGPGPEALLRTTADGVERETILRAPELAEALAWRRGRP